jgi:hypothetical protein
MSDRRPPVAARRRLGRALLGAAAGSLLTEVAAAAADWTNLGGNAGRNALSDAIGPAAPDVRWSGGDTSLIAWHPVIDADTVYVVRQTGFPPAGEPDGSPIFAYDLATGAERWRTDLPFQSGDWTTWIAGVSHGQVYASRSGNGASVSDPLVALDAATGDIVWTSDALIDAGAYDGVVFAPDGDPIVGSFTTITRIDAATGDTVWQVDRACSVSGNCGVALHEDRIYAVDVVGGGQAVRRFDLATGAAGPQGPTMPGFTLQNTPMVAPDGTIYVARTQNNPDVDFFYAFGDEGSLIREKWNVPAAWNTRAEHGVGPDGSVYMMAPGNEFVRLDPADGSVLDSAGVLPGFSSPRMAIGADGRVYLSNGAFATGRLYAFEADLQPLWDVPVTNINIGGPALAADGTLLVVGNGTQVIAFTGGDTGSPCAGDVDGDGATGLTDLLAVLGGWGPCGAACPADLDGDGAVELDDLLAVLSDWNCAG